MRFAHFVLGPAGSGKSTYCATLQNHGEITGRTIHIVNLDPAAEYFAYKPTSDIRDLIQVDDVLEADDLSYGPNGGLVFCMEYLVETDGLEWLKDALGDYDDDYIIFDCPGQIELYTHMDVFKRLSHQLQQWDFRVCTVFLLDSQYMVDGSKFLSGTLTTLSSMVKLELPQVNVLSKIDLLNKQARAQLEMFLEPEIHELLATEHSSSNFNKKFHKLTHSLAKVIEDYSLVRFIPFNLDDEETISNLLTQVDLALQYGEDADVKTKDYDYPEPNEEDEMNLFNNMIDG